jgi:hypothetical protein
LFVDVNNQAIQVTLFGNAMFEKYVESSVLSLTNFMVCPEAKNAFCFKTNKANLYLLSNSICNVKLMESISSFPKQVMQITIYGCVETQDRGSLHIHMLIWLFGTSSPIGVQNIIANSNTVSKIASMFLIIKKNLKYRTTYFNV